MQYYTIQSLATRKPLFEEDVEADKLPEILPALTEKHGAVILIPVTPDWWDRVD